jgi:hypothetical protein
MRADQLHDRARIRILLVAWFSSWRWCRSRCWGYVKGVQADLPSIALTNKNIGPIAFDFDGAAVRVLNGLAQFPVEPYRIATRSYEANGIRIGLGCMVFGMPLLELVSIPILYS